MDKITSREAWVALSLALGPRSRRLKPLLTHFKTPQAILAASDEALTAVLPDLGRGTLTALSYQAQAREVRRILSYCDRAGVSVLTPESDAYPASLFAIAEPPAVLYCLGKLPAMGRCPFVGVVGTREVDAYGERVTYKLSFELAAAGAVIVSGLAAGVDGIAAAAALDAGGATVAVIGCGIDRVYPRQHTRLFSEIAEFGAVISEFAPGTPPNAGNFPIRNRIISALSEAVVVVEADQTSGALITARYALLQGKELFAVPGDIDSPRSSGCNLLLRAGADIALSAEDILARFRFLYRDLKGLSVPGEALQYAGVTPEKLRAHGVSLGKKRAHKDPLEEKLPEKSIKDREPPKTAAPDTAALAETLDTLGDKERAIYGKIPDAPFVIDCLVGDGVAPGDAVAAMTLFEILGIVTAQPGGTYKKSV